jgi:predicted aspartyl protease
MIAQGERMMQFSLSVAIAAVAMTVPLASSPARADDKCHLYRIAQIDMAIDESGRVDVPMTINGRTVNLLVDTGGYVSTLTRSTVTSLGLSPVSAFRPIEQYYGGEKLDRFVTVHDAQFAGVNVPKLQLFVMSDGRLSSDEDGTISPDIMRNFDVDFDFANAAFSLFSKDHCEGRVVYWTQGGYAQIKFGLDADGHIRVPVTLDGRDFRASFDTGAMNTVASLEGIEDEFNLDSKSPALRLLPESDAKHHTYHYPFATLAFGGVTVSNPDLLLIPNSESHFWGEKGKLILGMNVLRRLHLYIAYGEHALYVTPATAH